MKKLLIFVSFFLSLTGWLFGQPFAIYAQRDSPPVELPLESLNASLPVRLSGIYSNERLDFFLPESFYTGEKAELNLSIEASPLLDRQQSSITVLINESNVTSMKLANFVDGHFKASIPAEKFHEGPNSIIFMAGLFLPEDKSNEFKNWNDPARWVSFKPESSLLIELLPNEAGYTLNDVLPVLGNTYLNQATGQPLEQTLVILPDTLESDDLSALTSLSYAINSLTDLRPVWTPRVIYESEFNETMAENANLILINNFSSGSIAYEAADKDYLSIATSPYNPHKAVLLIADRNRRDGSTPADILSHPDRKVLLEGVKVYLSSNLPAAREPVFKPVYTLESLGYQDRTVFGVGDNDVIYKVYVPYNTRISDATFNMILSHAPDLDNDTYRLNVFINGRAIAGLVLNQKTAASQPVPISLPVGRFRPGTNYLRISFNLQLGNTAFEVDPKQIWATVSNQSNLTFASTTGLPIEKLDYFPMPFSDNPSSLIVVSDHPSDEVLQKLATLAGQFGQSANLTDRPVRAIKASDYKIYKPTDKYVMFIGTYNEIPAIREINTSLPQAFTEDGKSLMPGYGVYKSLDEQPPSLGVIEILESPLRRDGAVMIVSGTDEKGVLRSLRLVADKKRWSALRGNLVLIGAGTTVSHNETDAEVPVQWQLGKVSSIPLIGPYLQNIAPANLVPALVSIIAAFVLLIVMILILQFGKGKK